MRSNASLIILVGVFTNSTTTRSNGIGVLFAPRFQKHLQGFWNVICFACLSSFWRCLQAVEVVWCDFWPLSFASALDIPERRAFYAQSHRPESLDTKHDAALWFKYFRPVAQKPSGSLVAMPITQWLTLWNRRYLYFCYLRILSVLPMNAAPWINFASKSDVSPVTITTHEQGILPSLDHSFCRCLTDMALVTAC